MKSKVFDSVQGLNPGRSVFNLSYAKKFSGVMGNLYPVMFDEVVPGDVFDLGAEAVIRFAPMVAPVLHEIVLKADWFFVPYRILSTSDPADVAGPTSWERFITGGEAGLDATVISRLSYAAPAEGSLYDHLGFPPGLTLTANDRPVYFPIYAYNLIYNAYFRDPNAEAMRAAGALSMAQANWDADYFTRALPWQQRGTQPALPVSGNTSAVYTAAMVDVTPVGVSTIGLNNGVTNNKIQVDNAQSRTNLLGALNANTVSLASATSVNIADLRLAVQLQRWMERNSRSGYRYTEFLRSHFGVAPRDERLDRPEYIGGIRQPIVVSEVLQTSVTAATPQGNMAGHGILAGRHNVGRYHVKEYGMIMALMSVVPRPAYQQGINRQWTRVSRYEYYHPEFANLSEQAILNKEIYADNTAAGTNEVIWGYQGRYDEMRWKPDIVSGAFRTSLNYWHLGRIFGALPALNATFGHVDPATITRVFAAPGSDHLYVHWGNHIKAIRPLPPTSNPGRLDHTYGGF